MGEYDKRQRKPASRAVANNEIRNKPLKKIVNNRYVDLVKSSIQCSTLQRVVNSKPDADGTITADLGRIDAQAGQGNNNAILNTVCGGDTALSTAILTASSSIGSQSCGGVSRDTRNVIHAESCIFNRLSATEQAKVSQINNRQSGVHSEVHHYNQGNLASVWTSQPNCFFCSGFLQHTGIGHQDMRTGYIFPQMWTSDGGRWKIIKDTTNYSWDIVHGTTHGKYKKDA